LKTGSMVLQEQKKGTDENIFGGNKSIFKRLNKEDIEFPFA